jgi:hypothetical protein
MSYDVRGMSVPQTEPTLRCPRCGHGLYTVDQVSGLTGQSVRTLQRRLEAGAIPDATRESVPGGFRWLVPLEAVQGRVAEVLPPLLEKLLPEIAAARTALTDLVQAERRRSDRDAALAARTAEEALFRAIQRSREASDWFTELQGWVIDDQSAPLIMTLQRAAIDFRRSLSTPTPNERIAALDDLLVQLETAIRLCREYRAPASAP